MNIKSLHPNFKLPTKGSPDSAGYDLYMPEAGKAYSVENTVVRLGFAAEIPQGYFGMIVPRSGVGFKQGLELNNTCGIIDSDYRGEWCAALRLKGYRNEVFEWEAGARLLQVIFMPVVELGGFTLVNHLGMTDRGTGGFGSSGI